MENIKPGQRFSKGWREAADIVSRVNTELVNSTVPAPQKMKYVIKQGDTLSDIAKKFDTSVGALLRTNDLSSTSPVIYPGDVLQIYTGEWSITVYKDKFRLILRDEGRIFKVYEVGLGRQDRTPVGTFRVKNKLRHPDWTPPGKWIPYGNPDNILGTHWMGLEPVGDTSKKLKGYGIHGTWAPETVGKPVSNGCVRLTNEQVHELFDLVPVGTRVVIKETENGNGT